MFRGTERFELLRRIGEGGMGVVYEAYDHEQATRVALKTLRFSGRDSLLRFKNEFRALRDVYHRNLVSLGELCERDGEWFYTMQYVDGVNFLAYVERRGAPITAPLTRPSMAAASAPRAVVRFDEARLRSTLYQLAAALGALHSVGKVHRDIKPGNILVTPEGSLYLLDFGLVTDTARTATITQADRLVGTPAFMSPEQARGELRLDPRSDCYSVGVLVYRAVTGILLATGSSDDIIASRRTQPAMRPSRVAPGVPRDLDELCFELLSPRPARRPSAAEICQRLRGSHPRSLRTELAAVAPARVREDLFVGRGAELGALHEAFAACAPGRPVVAFITGESGVGKSELLQHLVTGLADDREVILLRGRCYEREAVPYKGVDGVVDALSDYLATLPRDQLVPLLPARIAMVAATFPVLERVEAIASARRVSLRQIDPQLQRPMMFQALRDLLARIARRRAVVIAIDDFQWTDADSLALLGDVLRPSEPPGIFLVATLRGDAVSSVVDRWPLPQLVRHVQLTGLPASDARELASRLAGRYAAAAVDTAAIADAAGGHPLFIDALVRHALAGAQAASPALSLHDALRARMARLSGPQIALLEVLAIAAAPLELGVLVSAVDRRAELAGLHRDLSALRTASLVRMTGVQMTDAIELYHDQIGAALRARLDEVASRAWHQRLAIGLDALDHRDPDRLTTHWLGAGVADRAAACAIEAATDAVQSLAFERAGSLLQLALELLPAGDPRRPELQVQLAAATSFMGRGQEAAQLYCAAAVAGAGNSMELYRRAAELLLMQGHTDAGIAVLRRALAIAELPVPRSTPALVLGLVLARTRARLRGRPPRLRPAGEIAPEVLGRIDLCFTASVGLGTSNPFLGALFQARHSVLAFAAGEPSRMALALFADAIYAGVFGFANPPRVQTMLAEAHQLATTSGVDRVMALGAAGTALVEGASGRWLRALELLVTSEQILYERCRGTTWELGLTRVFYSIGLVFTGQLDRLCELRPGWVRDAEDRNDISTAMHLRIGLSVMADLFADRAAEVREHLRRTRAQLGEDHGSVDSFMVMYAEGQLAVYDTDDPGDAGGPLDEAQARLDASAPRLARSFLLRAPYFRILYWDLRARVALAFAAHRAHHAHRARSRASDALGVVREALRRLRRERDGWAAAVATAIEASLAELDGDVPRAAALWHQAVQAFTASNMQLHAELAHRRACLLEGDAAEVARIERELAARGARRVDRLANVYLPGRDRQRASTSRG